MNYNETVFRTKQVLSTDFCVHSSGLTKETCGICSGIIYKKVNRKTQDIDEKLVEKYNMLSLNFPVKNQEDWEEDEIFVVYMNMKEIRGTKLTKNAIYRTAIELQRTIGAINWCVYHLFNEREDLHRSNIMINFRKEFGLNKGGNNVSFRG